MNYYCEICNKNINNKFVKRHLSSLSHKLNENKVSKIKYIYHISDIHIKCNERHDEYKLIFDKFINEIDNNKLTNCNNSIIIITGDLFDNKNVLTSEAICLAKYLIDNLANRMSVILIAGNHDIDLKYSSQKIDNIQAILSNNKNIIYYKDTGIYKFKNITFGVTSVFDYALVKADDIVNDNQYKIALFHGIVKSKYVNFDNKNYNFKISDFDNYDFVLLGDIHKHIILKENMAYAGSLIQQNFGEDINNHGYILWDLENKKILFKEINNDYCYANIKITNTGTIIPDILYNKKVYVKWNIYINDNKLIEKYINEAKSKITIISENKHFYKINKNRTLSNENNSLSLSIENQENYIKQWLELNNYNLDDNEIKDIINLNNKINNKVENNINIDMKWRLIDIEFENLFCYNSVQYINFESFKNIVGIIAPNNYGKSAIFDIILFALFGKCTRSDFYTYRDLIYNRDNTSIAKCKIKLECNNNIYIIYREIKNESKNPYIVKIYKNNNVIYSGTPTDANKLLKNIIGSYEHFIAVYMISQLDIYNFIYMNSSNKRDFICKLFNLNLFENIYTEFKSEYKDISKMYDTINNKVKKYNSTNLKEKIEKLTIELKYIDNQINNFETNYNNVFVIKNFYNNVIDSIIKEYNKINNKDISNINTELNDIQIISLSLINCLDNIKINNFNIFDKLMLYIYKYFKFLYSKIKKYIIKEFTVNISSSYIKLYNNLSDLIYSQYLLEIYKDVYSILESYNIQNVECDKYNLIYKKSAIQTQIDIYKDKFKKYNELLEEYKIYEYKYKIYNIYKNIIRYDSGIPAMIINKYIKQLEILVNNILIKYSNINIKINYENKDVNILAEKYNNYINAKMLCGSEKVLLELAFRLAFKYILNKTNFMIIDEALSFLDKNTIENNLSNIFNIILEFNDYILLVSHNFEINNYTDKRILIQYNNKREIVQY